MNGELTSMPINLRQILRFEGGEIMNNNQLKHYGVLGMKWGVRRKSKKSVETSSSSSSKSRSVRDLSDAELRQIINRHQMEKQYAQITAKEKSAGVKFVSDVLTNAAKQTATSYTAKYMSKGMDALIAQAAKQSARGN